MREVHEEIGIDLSRGGSFFMGKLPINMFTYLKRGKKTYISTCVFLTLENLLSENDPTDAENLPIPNEEVHDAWWVPFNSFYENLEEKMFKIDNFRPSGSWLLNSYYYDCISQPEIYN